MNKVFADRFKSARLLNGLSLQDLANKLENRITRQAIYRYEKGEVIPNSDMIAMLSDVMNVRPDFFFRDTKVELGVIEYRKLHIPAKEESKIVEQTRDYLSRYLELEEILGLENNFENPLEDFPAVTEYTQVNEAANTLRTAWELGKNHLSNIPELLEDKHVKVVKINAETSFDGMQTYVNKNIPVVAYNDNLVNRRDRIRFTLLHELAHLLLKFGDITHNQKEVLCHQFAGAMLLPEETIKNELGGNRSRLSVAELGNVKKQYGISMQAIVMRANECNIVNDKYKRQFFGMMKQMNWRSHEPIAYEGPEESGRFDQLLHRALAEELISQSKAASLKNQSLAEFRKQSLLM